MERMNQKKYNVEVIGSKNSIRILRYLIWRPHILRSITEISRDISMSRSNVYRAVKSIELLGIIIQIKNGRKKLYKVDVSSHLTLKFFEIFAQERFMNLPSKLINSLSAFFQIASRCDAMILFGSYACGLSHEFSDIDICCICENEELRSKIKRLARKYYPDLRFEIHFYDKKALEELNDFVVLDSLLNGIPFIGGDCVFRYLSKIQNFPKSYILYRLGKCEEYMKKINSCSGPAKEYFRRLVTISIGEINSVLKLKTTIPKKNIKNIDADKEVKKLHDVLARIGDSVWLI